MGVGSGSPSDDFEMSSDHGGKNEIPHLVPDRLAKVNGWGLVSSDAPGTGGLHSLVEMKKSTVKATVAGREGVYP